MTATTYTVGATFRVIDEASPALKIISDGFAKLDGLAKSLQSQFDLLGKFKFGALEGALGAVGIKLDEITKQGDGTQLRLREIADTRFSGLNRGLTGVATRLGRIEAQAKLAGSALNGLPQLPSPGGGGGGNRHPRPGQPTGGGHSNTYGRHGVGVDAGIFGFLGFEAVKGGVEATLHRGMELAHVQEQMRQAGISQADIDRATGSSWQQARTYGLDVSKVLGDVKELTLPFGSVDHAIEFLDPLEKMRVVLNAVSEGRGTQSADAVYQMARAGELKGLQNPEEYVRYFDGMTKAISASGGKVTPQAFAQATQYGKLASFGWGEDFYTRSLPTMIQSMNPSTAGQSLMSLFSTLSGQVSQKAFGNIQDLGLISDPSKIVHTKTGIQFKPGAIKGYEEFVSNPLAWAKDILDPLLEAKYGDLGNVVNKEKAIGELQGLFGNRNSAAAVAELALRSKSFDKDGKLVDQAHGTDGAAALLANDPTTAMNNFSAAWTNLLTALGGPAVKPATDMLNGISGALNRVGEFAQAHPKLAKDLEGLAGGLAVGLAGLAAVGLAAFLPGSAAVIALATIGPALAGLAAVNWDGIKAAIGKLPAIIDEVTSFFSTLTDKLISAVYGFFSGILSKMQSIPGIGRFFGSEGDGGLAHKTAFESWDDGGADSPLANAVAGGFLKAFQQLGMGGSTGSGTSGFTNASFETFDPGPSGGGSLPSIRYGRPHSSGPGPSTAGASRGGDDPAMTARARESWDFWKSKGLSDGAAAGLLGMEHGENNFLANSGMFGGYGDGGAAYGSFMWHKDRRARIFAGTGINVIGASHQKQLEAAFWEMQHGEAGRGFLDDINRLGPAAAAALGVNGFERPLDRRGASRLRGAYAEQWYRRFHGVGKPPVARPKPSSSDIIADARQPDVHIHLDGKKIAHVVGRQMASAATYSHSIGGRDTHGYWPAPGDTLTDAG